MLFRSQDYFPLHLGNQWVYAQSGRLPFDPVVVDIAETRVFDGRQFSRLRGLPDGPVWLHQDSEGVLYSIDPETMRVSWVREIPPT